MAETPRLSALKKLSSQIPVANSRIAQGQQAARDIQLQQAVKQAPASAGTSQAQQLGAQQTAAAGQQQLATQEAGMQQQGQVADLATQAIGQQQQSQMAGLEQGVESQRLNNVERLAQLSEQAKQEMFDSRMEFKRDQMGRTQFNERQLADYAVLNAENSEKFAQYAQEAKQAHQIKIQSLEAINNRLQASIQSEAKRKEEGLDRVATQKIVEMQREVQEKLARAKADAANKAGMWGAIGAIAGGTVGAVVGGPTGAMIGSQLGGGLGTMAAGSSSSGSLESARNDAITTTREA